MTAGVIAVLVAVGLAGLVLAAGCVIAAVTWGDEE